MPPRLRRRHLPALLLPGLAACRKGQPAPHDPLTPAEKNDGWTIGRAHESGFNEAALRKLTGDLQANAFPNTHLVLVEHEGRLIYEQYLAGSDERWGTPNGHQVMDAESLHDLRSISKSFTAALLGIALGEQAEAALTRSIATFFPQRTLSPALQAVTLQDVLTMTAGLTWNEMTVPYTSSDNDEIRMSATQDPIGMVLTRPLREKPGTTWYYNGGLTQVLAGVVEGLTGDGLDAYAQRVLFGPLGIRHEWLGDPSWQSPMPAAASGLRMRGRDLAKFGSLYLHQGQWQGRQVIPAGWVARSMQRHVASIGDWGNGVWGYGYQMWVGRFAEGYDVAAGVGNGNQRVFVLPAERIVVSVMAGEYNKFEGHSERLLRRIMAARKSGH